MLEDKSGFIYKYALKVKLVLGIQYLAQQDQHEEMPNVLFYFGYFCKCQKTMLLVHLTNVKCLVAFGLVWHAFLDLYICR